MTDRAARWSAPARAALLCLALVLSGAAQRGSPVAAGGVRVIHPDDPRAARPARARYGSRATDLPNESLIRDPSTHKVYLIWAGVRYRLNSSSTMAALGLSGMAIATPPEATVQAMRQGPTLRLRLAHGLVYPLSPIESGHARLVLALPAAPPGTMVGIQGSGFGADESVQLSFGGATSAVQSTGARLFSTSVTIPAGSVPGSVLRLYAYGSASGVLQVEPISVINPAPAPLLSSQPPAPTQGSLLQVSGSGFAPGERIDVFLAQGVSAVEVTADATGSFTGAVVPIPVSLSARAHSLIAFGINSKLLASGTVLIAAPGAPAGGSGGSVGAGISLSRYTAAPGSLVQVSLSGFAPGEQVSVSLNGGQVLVQAADTRGAIAAAFSIPGTLAAGSYAVVARGTASGRTARTSLQVTDLDPAISLVPGNGPPGDTVSVQGRGFAPQESVTLALDAQALQLAPLVTSATGTFSARFTIPPTAQAGANTVAATGSASRGMAVASLNVSLPVQSTWYFAGGSTMAGSSTQIALLNPNSATATVRCIFMFTAGATIPYTTTVAPDSRATIDVGAVVGPGRQVFTMLTADQQIGAAQAIYRNGQDFSTEIGAPAAASTWYLAEGYTGGTFHEYLSLLDPGQTAAHVTIQLLPFNGRPALSVERTVEARSGLVLDVNALAPGRSLSALVDSDVPVVAERLMTFGAGGYGATEQTGSTAPAGAWLFAEGSTLNNFETYLTVLNPSSARTASVTASFYDQAGNVLGDSTIQVEPLHRGNIKVNDTVRSSGIATVLSSNVPVVVERPFYFGAPNGARAAGGSDVLGRNGGALRWLFPEGATQDPYREFLLLQNASGRQAQVLVRFYGTAGQIVDHPLTLAPRSRATIDLLRDVPGLPRGQHGTLIASTNGVPIIAEQSIYSDDFTKGDGSSGIAR